MTDVDLTNPGAVSNGLIGSSNELDDKEKDINMTGSKDGLNGSSNELHDKSKDIKMAGSKDGVNGLNKSQEVDLTGDPKIVPNESSNLMGNSKDGPDGLASAKPANGEIGLLTEVEDKSKDINMNGSNDGLGKVPASTKPANGALNALNQLDIQVNVTNISGPEGTEDALSSTESVLNKDGVGQVGGVLKGGLNVPLSSKPGQSVGFSVGDDMSLENKVVDNHIVNNTASNAGRSTRETLATLKKITPVWSISQHKYWSEAFVSIQGQIWEKSNHSKIRVSFKV